MSARNEFTRSRDQLERTAPSRGSVDATGSPRSAAGPHTERRTSRRPDGHDLSSACRSMIADTTRHRHPRRAARRRSHPQQHAMAGRARYSSCRYTKDVYRLATSPDTFEARCAAACLADPSAIITGVAAARLWELPTRLAAGDSPPPGRPRPTPRSRKVSCFAARTSSTSTDRRRPPRRHRGREPTHEPGSTALATSTTSASNG